MEAVGDLRFFRCQVGSHELDPDAVYFLVQVSGTANCVVDRFCTGGVGSFNGVNADNVEVVGNARHVGQGDDAILIDRGHGLVG